MRNAIIRLKAFTAGKKGQGMVEYGLIIALVAIAVITVLTLFGDEIANVFTDVTNGLAIR